jgi:hypothetical protein
MIEIDKDLRHIIRMALDIAPEMETKYASENPWLDEHNEEVYDKFNIRSLN